MPRIKMLQTRRDAGARVSSRQRQAGAATVIVVMILFFLVTLAAAYASRNLIFEQRTAANQSRSTSAQEVAEAGIEWAVTMLNAGRIDENCAPIADTAKNTFRQRYLQYDDSGLVSAKLLAFPDMLWAACVFDGTSWNCRCPDPSDASPSLPNPLPAGFAAFGVRFSSDPMNKPGTIRMDVNGCTSNSRECVTAIQPNTDSVKCQGTVCAVVAQYPALRMQPVAAITAIGTIEGTRLEVVNADIDGVTVHASGGNNIPSGGLILGSAPGAPPSRSTRLGDTKLGGLEGYSEDCNYCLFSSVFGLKPSAYREQQGVVRVDCSTACTSASLASEVGKAIKAARGASEAWDPDSLSYLPRGSVLWLTGAGGLQLSLATDVIGSLDAPMTVIVEGPLSVNGPAKIFGLVYAASATINDGDPTFGAIQGALVSAGTVTGSGIGGTHGRVTYNSNILEKVRKFSGTFVRVPGGWRDFP